MKNAWGLCFRLVDHFIGRPPPIPALGCERGRESGTKYSSWKTAPGGGQPFPNVADLVPRPTPCETTTKWPRKIDGHHQRRQPVQRRHSSRRYGSDAEINPDLETTFRTARRARSGFLFECFPNLSALSSTAMVLWPSHRLSFHNRGFHEENYLMKMMRRRPLSKILRAINDKGR